MKKSTLHTSAPTPGQKLAAALERECPEDRLARVISEGLTATQQNRDGTVSPDFRTRLSAAQLALFYKHGKPVERSEVIQVTASNDAETLRRVLQSPASRAALRKVLDDAEAAPAVDV